MTHGPTPYTDPSDVYEEQTATMYCEDCDIEFEVAGEIVDGDPIEFTPDPDIYGSLNVYCPNDPASDDYDPPTHDLSIVGGQ